jgi:excisionase family DNA binding protein
MGPPSRPNLDYLLTVEDLAKLYKVSKRTVWRWSKAGRIPAPVRCSKISVRWRASDIQKHLDTLNGASAAPPNHNDQPHRAPDRV